MMGGWQVFAATMVMVGMMTAVVLGVRPQRIPHGRTVAEIRQRLLAEALVPASLPPAAEPHSAPDHPLAIPEAHRTMQQHLDCTVTDCERKAAAFRVLVAAGRLKPR
ncbi:hypothetical protein NDR87_21015 [Nocardia sp. CDC159]|uniref:Uncharacterized protein n=1 Tax=Nocardia pulmonis TaxID=2951408 RepID=A0A9X2E8T8_9NOCA|nr:MULTISPECIES: hypothetical protein [Nocardia]MCM6776429.1 hypothetical protein [Nocardia pulmonis]MCM6788853.1 hypothetical protein [Nocardia sp. CDC159]